MSWDYRALCELRVVLELELDKDTRRNPPPPGCEIDSYNGKVCIDLEVQTIEHEFYPTYTSYGPTQTYKQPLCTPT